MAKKWAISVVSHGHGATVTRILGDLHQQLAATPHEFILTLNAGEDGAFVAVLPESLRQRLHVIRNSSARGFGANHNAALRDREADFVLIADPDLAAPTPVFSGLETALADPRSGIVAPLAITPAGIPEDNGRAIVTPLSLIRRRLRGRHHDACPMGLGPMRVDWLAGLCLALRAETFKQLGGFDERYYMYCEDVDLGLRARALGLEVLLLSDLSVIHRARRRTLRNAQHLRWHIASLLRLWQSPAYRRLRRPG
jgi:N-acetylglucosaminyl-diphospho-decaprenol L-rhamnosyltransferase